MVSHWSLNDSKSPQVSWTRPSILAVLNNVVVWMVSTRLPTSKSSSPFSNPFVTVPNALITIGIIVTCMFHSFFNSRAKSPQVSRTRLRILTDLINVVVWVVSTRPLIFKSSSPCIDLSVTVPRAPITISITVTFMFHSLFVFSNSLTRLRDLSFFSLSFNFSLWSAGAVKSTTRQVLFFLFFIIIRSGRQAEIR